MSQYPAKTIAKAKLQREQGHTAAEIAKTSGVSVRTVDSWISKFKWVKGALTEKIVKKHELSLLAKADEIGLTEEYILNNIKELIDAENVAMPTGTGYATLPINKDTITEQGFMGIPKDDLVIIPDRKIRLDGVKLLSQSLEITV